MDIGKYKQAMRPKKYLDGKFVIYDETMPDASDAQLETRENFEFGGGAEAQKMGTEASRKYFKERKVDKPTPVFEGPAGSAKLTDVKFANKAQEAEYTKLLKDRFKFPKGSKEAKKVSTNADLAKKFGITINNVERVNRALINKLSLTYPAQTYEGREKIQRERDKVRKENIKKTSSGGVESKIKRDIKKVDPTALAKDVDVAHRASLKANANLGSNYLTTSLGIDAKVVNQSIIKPIEQKLGTLYQIQKNLIKDLEPGNVPKDVQKKLEKVNLKISELADRTDGVLQGVLVDEKTLKPRIYGIDYSKVLGFGLVDKPVSELTQADRDLIKLNVGEQIKAAKKPNIKSKLLTQIAPGITTADKIQRPESAMTREMFDRFNKLRGVLIPGLEEIKDSLKKLPDDIKSKRYFTAALKGLGIVATPLIVSGMYNDFKSGKTVMETLERNLIGTDAIGGMKDIFALSPEEREARSVVKQAEMDEQIAQDFSGLDTDFQTPRVESKMSLEEALKEYEEGLSRVELEREQEEAGRAEGRASSFEGLKDLMLGERFQPQEIPQQFLASGGRVGFADGTPPDPSKRKFMKIMGALAAVPVIGKYFNLAKPLTKAAPAAVETVKSIPPYFFKMVEKVKQFGDDVTKRFATQEREQVYNYRTSDADYELYEDLNTGDVRLKVIKGDPDFPGYKEQELTLTKGRIDEKTGNVPDEYDEYTVRSDFDGKMKDIDEGIEGIDDLIEDTIGFENVSIKELEDMGYDVNRLSPGFKKKLGIK
jgi:hypothetical protein